LGRENQDSSIRSEQAEDLSNKAQWIRRQGTAIEIGWTCVFLASGMAGYITGAEIYATGGFELGNGLRLTREEVAQSLKNVQHDSAPPRNSRHSQA